MRRTRRSACEALPHRVRGRGEDGGAAVRPQVWAKNTGTWACPRLHVGVQATREVRSGTPEILTHTLKQLGVLQVRGRAGTRSGEGENPAIGGVRAPDLVPLRIACVARV